MNTCHLDIYGMGDNARAHFTTFEIIVDCREGPIFLTAHDRVKVLAGQALAQ
jgi:hypothetical protein